MAWTPEGIINTPALQAGTYPACILVSFDEAKPSPTGKYQRAWVAVYRDTESGAEVIDWIKFDGSTRDYYAGLRMEALHSIMGADINNKIDCKNVMDLSNGIIFTVEMKSTEKNGKVYCNIPCPVVLFSSPNSH